MGFWQFNRSRHLFDAARRGLSGLDFWEKTSGVACPRCREPVWGQPFVRLGGALRQRSAIVLVVDRLGAGYLGPYGNTWVETPELNRLASQSLLFEFPIADAYELESLYRSYWFGCHALSEPVVPACDRPTLPATLQDLRSTLLTDDPRLAALSLADDFDQRIALAIPDATVAARNAEETQLGQFFAAALDWMSRAKHPYLLWLHTRALAGAWDAPVEYRERFRDDDDPVPADLGSSARTST